MNNFKVNAFPQEVIDEIGYYVYRLIDPRNGETFYVGKGKGNRVFSHIKASLKEEEKFDDEADENLKYGTIKRITNSGLDVIHIIHRHKLDEKTAFEVEGALIDAYSGATNIQNGKGNSIYGAMNAYELINRYQLETAEFKHNILMININRTAGNEDSILDNTRYAWRIDPVRARKADYVLAIEKGIIIGVFKALEWKEATIENFPGFRHTVPGRYGFIGEEAPEEIQKLYLRKKISDEEYRKKGAANPIKYSY